MNIEKINNIELAIKEYRNTRVVTFNDIDTVHERPQGTARKRFSENKKHFIEGEDYFKVCVSEIRTCKIMELSAKARKDITLITESGYLMLVKSFTDDLAWKVQRDLVNNYFRSKSVPSKSCLPEQATVPAPLQKNWYIRNKYRISVICEKAGVTRQELYHKILDVINQVYDIEAAQEIYKQEQGHYPEYAMDIVGYFPELFMEAERLIHSAYLTVNEREEEIYGPN